jgi:hypothetical protein
MCASSKNKTTTDENCCKRAYETEIVPRDSERYTTTDIDSPRMNRSKRKIESLAYKKVANKKRLVATTLPEEFRIVRRIPSDPLEDLPILPTNPPEFEPGERYTKE